MLRLNTVPLVFSHHFVYLSIVYFHLAAANAMHGNLPGSILASKPVLGDSPNEDLPAIILYFHVEDSVRQADASQLQFNLRSFTYPEAVVTPVKPLVDRQGLLRAVRKQMVNAGPKRRRYLRLSHPDPPPRTEDPHKVYAMLLDRDDFRRLGMSNIAGHEQKQTFAILGVRHMPPNGRASSPRNELRIGLYGFAEASGAPDAHTRLPLLGRSSGLAQNFRHILQP
ncbi:uncharacterized protein UTRI_06234_B [Ustilago trichophora]|uniref:Uncharacterized protein n=1 Tax=Ustilago trichophora TaxID=86804 RepID=A0A5C3EI64_9BASI|nr:uncharacterized protein UTRI_06234_B [Ustilago trichophora]